MIKIFGVDPGNSDLKIAAEGSTFQLKNAIAHGRERRLHEKEAGDKKDFLDISIEGPAVSGRYFVGDLALREGGQYLREKQVGDQKATNIDTYVLMLAGIAYQLHDPANPKKTAYIAIGSGLPTEEFYDCSSLETFQKKLKGTHKITFHHPLFDQAESKGEVTLVVKELVTIPEGSAATVNQMYDDTGNLQKDKEVLNKRLIITIDIGAGTVDVSVMENGKCIGTLTFGLDKGIFYAVDAVIEDIARDYHGYRLSRHKLLQYLIHEQGVIPYKKETIQAQSYAEIRFEQLAADIAHRIANKLKRERPSIQDEVYTTLIVGGGAFALAPHFPKYFGDYQLEFAEDPIYANARGYYKVARNLIRSRGTEQTQE